MQSSSRDISEFDLTSTERDALDVIHESDKLFQSELWKELDVSSRTGTRVARSLEDAGLISREETAHNGNRTYELAIADGIGLEDSEPAQENADPRATRYSELPDRQQAILQTISQHGEQPLRELVGDVSGTVREVEDAVEGLLDEDLIAVERKNLYGREVVLVSQSK